MELFKHQKEAKEIASKQNYFGLFWNMGTGKTRATCEIIKDRFEESKRPLKTLILCPHVCIKNWENELKQWIGFGEKFVLGLDKASTRLKNFENRLDTQNIVIVNYEAVRTEKFYKALSAWGPEVFVCDESHRIKSPKAQTTKKVLKISDLSHYRYALTGTLMTNSPLDLFTQAFFLDRGKSFGKNFFTYRAVYMYDTNEHRKGLPNYFPNLVPRKSKFQDLTDKLSNLGTRVSFDSDLPPLKPSKYEVELSAKQKKYYKRMKDDAVVALEEAESSGFAVGPIAITQTLRLQQIVSGFLVDDEKNVIEIDPKQNNRLKACKELVADILEQKEKVIIWTCFKQDIKILSKQFKKEDPSVIDGQTKDKDFAIRRFTGKLTSKELDEGFKHTDVLIANRKAGGIGINLVEAKYSIVYSRNHSLEDELQSEKRNHRRGSERHSEIIKIDLFAKDTIDEEILLALKRKDNMSKTIVDAIRRK